MCLCLCLCVHACASAGEGGVLVPVCVCLCRDGTYALSCALPIGCVRIPCYSFHPYAIPFIPMLFLSFLCYSCGITGCAPAGDRPSKRPAVVNLAIVAGLVRDPPPQPSPRPLPPSPRRAPPKLPPPFLNTTTHSRRRRYDYAFCCLRCCYAFPHSQVRGSPALAVEAWMQLLKHLSGPAPPPPPRLSGT